MALYQFILLLPEGMLSPSKMVYESVEEIPPSPLLEDLSCLGGPTSLFTLVSDTPFRFPNDVPQHILSKLLVNPIAQRNLDLHVIHRYDNSGKLSCDDRVYIGEDALLWEFSQESHRIVNILSTNPRKVNKTPPTINNFNFSKNITPSLLTQQQ